MKDYYRILQIDPQAEQEVIDAAYRRLMRKYHPDVLPPDKRDSAEALQKVQDLNEAFEVLSNNQKRQQYDRARSEYKTKRNSRKSPEKSIPMPEMAEIERLAYLVRCSTTKQIFKMHLGRRQGWSGPFVVMSLERMMDNQATPTKTSTHDNLLNKLRSITRANRSSTQFVDPGILATPNETIENLFDLANTLSMGDIDWAGHKCPDCASEITNDNGTRATWSMCGTCHRLKCVGSAKKQPDGYHSTCPWCGAKNKLTRSIPTGSKDQAILRGRQKNSTVEVKNSLPDAKRKSLSDKHK